MVPRKRLSKKACMIGALAAMAFAAPASHAIVFELNKNQVINDWLLPADWNDLTTPSSPSLVSPGAGDTASTLNRLLRTTTGSSAFAATLNVNPGGTVLLKTTGTATIANGHLLGGTLSQGIAPNSTGTFGGNIAVDAASTIALNTTAGDVRTMILAAALSGSNNLNVDGGTGTASGTLRLTGSVANYTGTINLTDTAILDMQGSALAFGVDSNNGFTATGNGSVKFGTGSETMDVSRNNVANSGTKTSTVSASGTNGVQVNLATLRIGTLPSSANPGSGAVGTFILSQAGNNSIIAPTILMGDSPGSGNTSGISSLILGGATNTIDTTTFTIGGQKSNAAVSFGTAGGILNLGTSGDRVTNLRLGFNNSSGTGANTTGLLDGSNGTLNVFATNVVLGQHAGGGSGSGKGTINMAAGVFDVVTMTLGQPSGSETGTNELNTVGTFNLSGGTVKATNISKGLGTANFNMTGGTLIADNFNFNLSQLGGTVSPGGDMIIGTTNFSDDYTMNNLSTLAIDIANNAGLNDLVNVGGTAILDGTIKLVALSGFVPHDDFFDVLIADEIVLGSNLDFDTAMFLNRGMSASVIDGDNGGQILRLSVIVPEPATASLALLGLGGLMMRRRRMA